MLKRATVNAQVCLQRRYEAEFESHIFCRDLLFFYFILFFIPPQFRVFLFFHGCRIHCQNHEICFLFGSCYCLLRSIIENNGGYCERQNTAHFFISFSALRNYKPTDWEPGQNIYIRNFVCCFFLAFVNFSSTHICICNLHCGQSCLTHRPGLHYMYTARTAMKKVNKL
jgi:hypothetical protein